LIPFFDTFHHTPLSSAELMWKYDPATEKLTLKADKSVKAGEEVFVSFGEKCNSELVDYYGFLIEDNENDCVHIEFELLKSDPLFNHKNIIYRIHNFQPSKLKLLRGGYTQEVLLAARAVTLIPNTISSDMLLHGVPDESLGPVSDYVIADFMLKLIRTMYTSYPSSTEADQAALSTQELSPRARMALQLRTGEKNILQVHGRYFYNQVQDLGEVVSAMPHDEL